ncbi:MAG: hypothetical protein AAF515_06505 [Pseudomonadota bacterium]
MTALGICVNPMSGRDVRRLAGRASNMTHEAKRDIVARIATGADAVGVTDIYVTREPFQIAAAALDQLPLNARVHVIEHRLRNDARDTEASLDAYLAAGARAFVSLGGDGTNRAIVRTLLSKPKAARDDVVLVPLSTGTNNVYPLLAEPTIAGLVAGLYARGMAPLELTRRSKVLHVRLPGGAADVGLIDAVLLRRDHVGNLLPFDADKLGQLVLTRAEPDAVGMSPIGGYLDVVDADEDAGLVVHLGGDQRLNAPLSPGLFGRVAIAGHHRLPFDTPVMLSGPGVVALDGDRDHRLDAGAAASVTIRRDGPRVPDLAAVMRHASRIGIMAGLS